MHNLNLLENRIILGVNTVDKRITIVGLFNIESVLQNYHGNISRAILNIEVVDKKGFQSWFPSIYLHNWSSRHFSPDYGLVENSVYVVGVNCKHEWHDLQFKDDSGR